MNKLKNIFLLITFISVVVYAQETTVKLSTNYNTSSFNVTKDNGVSVFKADAGGRLTGDGSGLSNVKPLINYIGGNQNLAITKNYGSYDAVRTITLTAPSSGICFVTACGTVRWGSVGWDLLLSGILMDKDPNNNSSAENEWYSYLNIITDYNCPDSSDQYSSFSQHRCIPVSAGAHTFYLWANKYTSSSITRVLDVNMTVIFIPTGGTDGGIAHSIVADEGQIPDLSRPVPGSVDGHSLRNSVDNGISNMMQVDDKIELINQENRLLKKRLDGIEALLKK